MSVSKTSWLLAVAVLGCLLIGAQSAQAGYVLIDDFESYTLGNFNDGGTDARAPDGPWTARDGAGALTGTGLVRVESDGSTQHLDFGWNAGWRGAYRDVPDIAEGGAGTYYFQVRTRDDTPDASYGLTDEAVATGAGFSDFEAQVGLVDDGDGGNGMFNLIARNAGSFDTLVTGLSADTWYDVWIVANNAADTYSVFLGTTGSPNVLGTLVGSNLAFRNGTTDPLTAFMTLANGHDDAKADLDDIYYNPAAVPEPASAVLVILGMALIAWAAPRR